MEFNHVGQAGLELLTSSNPPALASQSDGITYMNHLVWPSLFELFCITIYMLLGFSFFFWDQVSLCHPGWSAIAWSQLTAISSSQVQAILPPQLPKKLGLQSCATTPAIFYIFSTDGVSHVGQAGLELLTSSNPPTLASQSAGFTGLSHRTRP